MAKFNAFSAADESQLPKFHLSGKTYLIMSLLDYWHFVGNKNQKTK